MKVKTVSYGSKQALGSMLNISILGTTNHSSG